MNWLARMEIDAGIARNEKIADNYAWHEKLWECFPGVPDKKRTEIGFITRIDPLEGAFRLWVLAKKKPVRPRWCSADGFSLNKIKSSFLSHRYYAFDLRANPVKTIVRRGPNGETLYQRAANGEIKLRVDGKPKRVQGNRVPLVKQEELRAWLFRKAEVRCKDKDTKEDVSGGFRIVEEKPLEISPMVESYFCKVNKKGGKKQVAFHGGVQFRGTLEVTDPEKFKETYQCGIGGAKGFGFGLLLLAPVKYNHNKP